MKAAEAGGAVLGNAFKKSTAKYAFKKSTAKYAFKKSTAKYAFRKARQNMLLHLLTFQTPFFHSTLAPMSFR
jgi:hypothetical protein